MSLPIALRGIVVVGVQLTSVVASSLIGVTTAALAVTVLPFLFIWRTSERPAPRAA